MPPPPLLQRHHEEWFAYRCADAGVRKLTGASLQDAAEVCTAISGAGFTEEIAAIRPVSDAFELAVGRIANAVLEQCDLANSEITPVRGSSRGTLVVGDRQIKCNRLEATAILAADALYRPTQALFGKMLDGENTWQTPAEGEKWVRETLSPTAPAYLAAKKASLEGATSLKPTALFNINGFMSKNSSSIYSFPTTVVSEITCTAKGEPVAIMIESTDDEPVEIATGETPAVFAVGADWPPTIRVRSLTACSLSVVVV